MKIIKPIWILGLVLTCLYAIPSQAQERIEDVMTLSPTDADKIMRQVMAPAANAAGFLQAEGWYNTAKPLKRFKFNAQIQVNGLIIRDEDQTFSLPNLNLESGTVVQGNEQGTTVFGDINGDTKVFNQISGDTVRIPAGIGIPVAPYPVVQFNVGLIKNTEVSLRFFPAIDIQGVKTGILGIGFKHDIKQWIPSIALSPYSLSFVGSFSNMNIDYAWNIINVEEEDQFIKFRNRHWSVGVIGSKRFAIFTVYAGVRYDNSASNVKLEGTYLVGTPAGLQPTNVSDFPGLFDLDYNDSRVGLSLGGKVKLGPAYLHIGGTISKQTTINAGIGIGFNE